MARRGRDLERLVAILEKALAPLGAAVRSPDLLPDRITGQLREVDVSIRCKIGEQEILAIGECRDRRKPEDVSWVEQVATKTRDLGAQLAFMVSSTSFSGSARKKAAAHGILLRRLQGINHNEIRSWFAASGADLVVKEHCLVGGEIHLLRGESEAFSAAAQDALSALGLRARILQRHNLPPVSLDDVWQRSLGRDEALIWGAAPKDGSVKRIRHHIRFEEPEKGFFVDTASGPEPVQGIVLIADIQIRRTQQPVSRVSRYDEGEARLARNVEIDLPLGDQKATVSFHRIDASGKVFVGLRLPED